MSFSWTSLRYLTRYHIDDLCINGLRCSLHSWIKDFRNERTQHVVLENGRSNTAPVQWGVPHGSVSGPSLFLLFINDLPNYTGNKSSVRLFADDYVLYREIKKKNSTDAELLQKDLETLHEWVNDWPMEFHPNRCQVIHFTNKIKPIRQPYNIHGHVLEEVECAKYLEANIHHKLSWATHIDQVVKKAKTPGLFSAEKYIPMPTKDQETLLHDPCMTTDGVCQHHLRSTHSKQHS